ncbi:hypothetical protein [Geodermatophilus sp. URMC 65]
MTSSAGVRRGERFDREQVVVDTGHRRVVVDLLADSGFPDVTGTDEPLPELGPTLLTVPGWASRGVPDLPDVDRLGAEPGDDAPDRAFLTGDVDVLDVRREEGRVVLGPTRRVAFPHGSARWHEPPPPSPASAGRSPGWPGRRARRHGRRSAGPGPAATGTARTSTHTDREGGDAGDRDRSERTRS